MLALLPRTIVRDVLAVIAIIAALTTTWDVGGDGSSNTWVLLTSLLAIAGSIVPHLMSASLVGRDVPQDQVNVMRVAAVVPLLLVVIVTLVRALAGTRGIGTGVACAAAAVVLIATNQRHEGPLSLAVPPLKAASVFYFAASLWILIACLKALSGNAGSTLLWALLTPFLGFAFMTAWVGGRLVVASAAAWAGGVMLALTLVAAVTIVTQVNSSSLMSTNAGENGGYLTLLAMGAAVSCAPGASRSLTPRTGGATLWVQAVIGMLTLSIISSMAILVAEVLTAIAFQDFPYQNTVSMILFIILAGGWLLVSIVLRGLLIRQPAHGRRVTVYAEVGMFLLSLILFVATGTDVSSQTLLVYFFWPVLVLAALTVPADVRAAFGPMMPAGRPVGEWHGSAGESREGRAPGSPRP